MVTFEVLPKGTTFCKKYEPSLLTCSVSLIHA